MMNLSRCFGIVGVLCLALPAMAADKPFPESMVTLRAQPAVFFVRATADVDLTVPESISVNFDVLKQDVGAAPNPGGLPLADRYWDQTLKSPDKYLVASKQQKTVPLS